MPIDIANNLQAAKLTPSGKVPSAEGGVGYIYSSTMVDMQASSVSTQVRLLG